MYASTFHTNARDEARRQDLRQPVHDSLVCYPCLRYEKKGAYSIAKGSVVVPTVFAGFWTVLYLMSGSVITSLAILGSHTDYC